MGPARLLSVERVGTGFMRLWRDCVERSVEAHPGLRVTDASGRRSHSLVDAGLRNGTCISEDSMFCDRWRAIGEKVLVAPGIRLRHVGTHLWRGTVADVLTARRTV